MMTIGHVWTAASSRCPSIRPLQGQSVGALGIRGSCTSPFVAPSPRTTCLALPRLLPSSFPARRRATEHGRSTEQVSTRFRAREVGVVLAALASEWKRVRIAVAAPRLLRSLSAPRAGRRDVARQASARRRARDAAGGRDVATALGDEARADPAAQPVAGAVIAPVLGNGAPGHIL